MSRRIYPIVVPKNVKKAAKINEAVSSVPELTTFSLVFHLSHNLAQPTPVEKNYMKVTVKLRQLMRTWMSTT